MLLNVRSRSGRRLEVGMPAWSTIERYKSQLGEEGRGSVRSSGTEHVARVTVEADSVLRAEEVARAIADAISKDLDS